MLEHVFGDDQLLLRPITLDDKEAIFDIFSNPEVMRYWARPAMTGPSEAIKMIEEIQVGWKKQVFYQWGIEHLGDHRIIGTCTLWKIDLPNKRSEIGYALHRHYWGQGLMHRALTLFIEHAFSSWDLYRLEADVDPRNQASLRSLEKLGFVREGYFRARWHVAGEVQDSIMFCLLKSDWEKHKKRVAHAVQ